MVSARPADDGPTFIVDEDEDDAATVVFLNARRFIELVHDARNNATRLERHHVESASLGINGAAAGPIRRSNEIVA